MERSHRPFIVHLQPQHSESFKFCPPLSAPIIDRNYWKIPNLPAISNSTKTCAKALITRRSLVQIQPPQPMKPLGNPQGFRHFRAFPKKTSQPNIPKFNAIKGRWLKRCHSSYRNCLNTLPNIFRRYLSRDKKHPTHH